MLEEGVQFLGDGQTFGGLPIGEARREGSTLSGQRARRPARLDRAPL